MSRLANEAVRVYRDDNNRIGPAPERHFNLLSNAAPQLRFQQILSHSNQITVIQGTMERTLSSVVCPPKLFQSFCSFTSTAPMAVHVKVVGGTPFIANVLGGLENCALLSASGKHTPDGNKS